MRRVTIQQTEKGTWIEGEGFLVVSEWEDMDGRPKRDTLVFQTWAQVHKFLANKFWFCMECLTTGVGEDSDELNSDDKSRVLCEHCRVVQELEADDEDEGESDADGESED